MSITSRANPKVKAASSLRDRRDRDRSGLFLIEGYREIYHALKGGVEIKELFFCEDLFLGSNEGDLLQEAEKEAELISTSKYVFQKLSYRDRPDGLLAVAKQMRRTLDQVEIKKENPLIIIAEAIEKPGNLGTILRSGDAAGVDLVIVANGCTDIYNPNVVRASVGTLFTIPVVEATNEAALLFCQKRGVSLLAATPEAKTLYTKAPMKEAVAIVVGTEQLGLSSFWKKACDLHVSIPMHGVADSLNVATATTLILFEAVRQRT